MGFPDYDFTGPDHSYVWANEVLEFIRVYAKKFQVDKHIKFRHEIVRIRPRETLSKWEVIYCDIAFVCELGTKSPYR